MCKFTILTVLEEYTIMKYLLLAFLLTSAAPGATGAGAAEGRRETGSSRNAEAIIKEAAELEAAVARDPGNIELHIRLGFAYSRLEKADDAQRAFENVVRLDPARAIAHYMLGLIYEKKGLKEMAASAWKACLDNAAEQHLRETALKHLHHLKGS